MRTELFELTCSNESGDEIEMRTTVLELNIFDLVWLLENQTNREIRIKEENYPDDFDENCKFQVKFKFVGFHNALIEIYFLSPITVFVKPAIYSFSRLSSEWVLESDEKDSYQCVKANQWNFLVGLVRSTVIANIFKYSEEPGKYQLTFSVANEKTIPLEISLPGPIIEEDKKDLPKSHLMNDLENLFDNLSFSDVTVKSAEGVEFPAHKFILAIRSSVLNAHFRHNTVETLTNVVEFPFETKVVRNILNYIYTDKVLQIDEMLEKLLMAAEFYQLHGLKVLCEETLQNKLTLQNAIEVLELADKHTAAYLKKKTLEFINDGLSGEITKTEAWKRLKSVELLKTLYEYNIVNK